MTENHSLSSLNKGSFCFRILEVEKYKVKVLMESVAGEEMYATF